LPCGGSLKMRPMMENLEKDNYGLLEVIRDKK
jgi:hypothetical protein